LAKEPSRYVDGRFSIEGLVALERLTVSEVKGMAADLAALHWEVAVVVHRPLVLAEASSYCVLEE